MHKQAIFLLLILSLFTSHCASLQTWLQDGRQSGSDNFWVRVKIYEGKPQVIETKGNFLFRDYQGSEKKGRRSFVPSQTGDFSSDDNVFILGGKHYQGKLRIIAQGSSFVYVNYVQAFDYLVSVVGHEMGGSWPLAALKAQAVVARTYLINHLSPTQKYDVVSSTGHQVYGGSLTGDANLRRAVRETRGEIVTFDHKPAQVFYHANSGGITASAGEVWQNEHPYLVSRESPYAGEAPAYRWRYDISLYSLARLLNVQKLYRVVVKERSDSYRVKSVAYQSEKGWRQISGKELRKLLGYRNMRSTLFDVRINGSYLEIGGKGYGHGVGMGQWDAKVMAEKYNFDYRSIIYYFFPGTDVQTFMHRYPLPA